MDRKHFGVHHAVVTVCLLTAVLLLSGLGSIAQEQEAILDTLRARLIPPAGTETSYDILLDLRNTAQFIDWHYEIELTDAEDALMMEALSALVAPCCDDNSAATCCCDCNLARSVWGLSAYLIREKGFGVGEVQEAADQWLRFARSDYYIAAALEEEGLSPSDFGLTTFGSCYRGMCDFPVTEGGCAGMTALIEPAPATLPVVTPPEENECLTDDDKLSPAFGLLSVGDTVALIEAHREDLLFIVLDVRTPDEFAAGHISGAVNLDYFDAGFSEELEQLDEDAADATYLVYCRSGRRSATAVQIMQDLGFCCIYDLDGGILAWLDGGLEVE